MYYYFAVIKMSTVNTVSPYEHFVLYYIITMQ